MGSDSNRNGICRTTMHRIHLLGRILWNDGYGECSDQSLLKLTCFSHHPMRQYRIYQIRRETDQKFYAIHKSRHSHVFLSGSQTFGDYPHF